MKKLISSKPKSPRSAPHKSRQFAIALEYDGCDAPRVTAKGQNEIAELILSLAAEAEIPIHQDEELAMVLEQLDLGEQIPNSLYLVIAEVLSFAYRLSGKHKPFMDEIRPKQR